MTMGASTPPVNNAAAATTSQTPPARTYLAATILLRDRRYLLIKAIIRTSMGASDRSIWSGATMR